MAVVAVEIAGLFFFHQTREDKLTDIENQAGDLTQQIDSINALVKDHAKVKAALVQLRAREDAIAKLQHRRRGPIGPLLELSKVLTPGAGGPTADPEDLKLRKKNNPLDVYNPLWDARRVWLSSFNEGERSVIIAGLARDSGDVYEFSQRLKLSQYFDDVRPLKGSGIEQGPDKVELIQFELKAKVRY
jgi:type IV pilus assembly protein PilN